MITRLTFMMAAFCLLVGGVTVNAVETSNTLLVQSPNNRPGNTPPNGYNPFSRPNPLPYNPPIGGNRPGNTPPNGYNPYSRPNPLPYNPPIGGRPTTNPTVTPSNGKRPTTPVASGSINLPGNAGVKPPSDNRPGTNFQFENGSVITPRPSTRPPASKPDKPDSGNNNRPGTNFQFEKGSVITPRPNPGINNRPTTPVASGSINLPGNAGVRPPAGNRPTTPVASGSLNLTGKKANVDASVKDTYDNSARSSNQTQRNNNPQTGYSGFNGRGASGSWGNSQEPSVNTRNSNNRTMDNRARTPTRVPTPTRNSYEGTIDPTLIFADY